MQNKQSRRSDGKLCVIKSAESSAIILPNNTTMTLKGVLDKKNSHNGLALMQQVNDSTLSSHVEIVPLLEHYDEELHRVPIYLSNHSTGSIVIAHGSIICQLQAACQTVDTDSIIQNNTEVKPDNDSILDGIDCSEAALIPEQLHTAKQLI